MCSLDLIVCENYWLGNLGTIFKGINKERLEYSTQKQILQIVHGPGIEPPFLETVILDSLVCVFSISVCLQDELLFFQGLSEMVHSSLITCIKMGVSLTNPNNRQLYHFWTHRNTAHAGINGQHCSCGCCCLTQVWWPVLGAWD